MAIKTLNIIRINTIQTSPGRMHSHSTRAAQPSRRLAQNTIYKSSKTNSLKDHVKFYRYGTFFRILLPKLISIQRGRVLEMCVAEITICIYWFTMPHSHNSQPGRCCQQWMHVSQNIIIEFMSVLTTTNQHFHWKCCPCYLHVPRHGYGHVSKYY